MSKLSERRESTDRWNVQATFRSRWSPNFAFAARPPDFALPGDLQSCSNCRDVCIASGSAGGQEAPLPRLSSPAPDACVAAKNSSPIRVPTPAAVSCCFGPLGQTDTSRVISATGPGCFPVTSYAVLLPEIEERRCEAGSGREVRRKAGRRRKKKRAGE